ncbi:MAG: PKD domain-containing protein [Bacteroidales bacterium]|nr:PKD domain-containing protein [Bacteroidales bacterium]
MKSIFIILGLLVSIFCSAQKQGNIWYFGSYAGLDFNSGVPVALQNGQINAMEGTSSMCNSNGELLFYTDGVTVYDASHSIMSNGTGLWGNSHTTQSALIIPQPGSTTQYLIFTLDYAYSNGNFAYSVVDMTQNNGMGAVVLKNVYIQENCTEKMTAVFHENHQDIWVIIHERDNIIFKSYLVTSAGFVNNAVVSGTGPVISGPQGCLKVSSDGNLLAMATYHQKRAEIYNFDPATGEVAYDLGYTYPDATYGVEFSGDNTKLYVSVSYDIKEIYQVDLASNTNTFIASTGMAPGTMQLGPDGKIYVARYDRPNTGSYYLGVINSPDLSGAMCGYVDEAIHLGNGMSKPGLPNLLYYGPNQVIANFIADSSCTNQPVMFNDLSSTASGYILKWIWNFGDGTTDTIIFPENPNVQHVYQNSGTYYVSLTTITNGGYANSVTLPVVSLPLPIANFTYAGSCTNLAVYFTDVTSLNGGGNIINWQWNFGDPASGINNSSSLANPMHTYFAPDTFNVMLVVTNIDGCMDTIVKQVISNQSLIDFTNTTACLSEAVSFSPDTLVMNPETIATWLWEFGDGSVSVLSNPQHVYIQTGMYSVTLSVVDTMGCPNNVTHILNVADLPYASFDYTTTACTSSAVQFTNLSNFGNGQNVTWLWDFGDGQQSTVQNPTHTYQFEGNYWACLYVQNECGENLSCEHIVKYQEPFSRFRYDYLGNFFVGFVNQSLFAETVMWDFGDGDISNEFNPIHSFPGAGDYRVCLKVTNACNSISFCDTVHLDLFSGIQADVSAQGIMISPNPATSDILIESNSYKISQVEIFTSQGILTDTYVLKDFQNNYSISLKGKPSGIYILRILTEKGFVTKRLIIQ